MTLNFHNLSTSHDSLREALVRLGFIQFDEPFKVEELTGGISSTILKIEGPSGIYCIKQALPELKIAGTWNAPVERIYAEVAWLQLVAEIAPGCVPNVLGVDRETNSFAMAFLPHDLFPNWKSELLAGRVDTSFAAAVGATLASIHNATANHTEIKSNFANDDNFFALRLDPYLLETGRQHPDLESRLRELVVRTQKAKIALVHGDISPKNILMGPSGPVFLDAECAWYGDPAFDVAFCLNHLLLKSVANRDISASLFASFDKLADTYLSRVDWEPRLNIEQRIATLLPALTLARISGKSPVEYFDRPARQAVTKVARALVAKPAARLDELKSEWKKGFGFE